MICGALDTVAIIEFLSLHGDVIIGVVVRP